MKDNEELQTDVQNAINWETQLKAAEIGVIAKDGVVTLTGTVDSYAKKLQAEDAAKSVNGVKVVVVKLEVKLNSIWDTKDDSEIADEILKAARWNWQIPKDKIKAIVEAGWVTLEGEVQWNYQREAIVDLVKNHSGIKGITNNIIITGSEDQVEKKNIERALRRHWFLDASNIKVYVVDNNVTLTGSVESWHERNKAAQIAWNAPGVVSVDNQLAIEYEYELAD